MKTFHRQIINKEHYLRLLISDVLHRNLTEIYRFVEENRGKYKSNTVSRKGALK